MNPFRDKFGTDANISTETHGGRVKDKRERLVWSKQVAGVRGGGGHIAHIDNQTN